jgi:TPP-dependent pyruvate/acetoin dehydrogenase alpha subunit
MRYVPKQMFEEWEARDPIRRYEERLSADGVEVEPIRASVKQELESETEWALEQPMPDPASATQGVFSDGDPELGDGQAPWSRWSGGEAGDA